MWMLEIKGCRSKSQVDCVKLETAGIIAISSDWDCSWTDQPKKYRCHKAVLGCDFMPTCIQLAVSSTEHNGISLWVNMQFIAMHDDRVQACNSFEKKIIKIWYLKEN